MSTSSSLPKLVSSYMLISILFFGYNMLQLPKTPYFAVRFLLMLIVAFYALGIVIKRKNKYSSMSLFLGYFFYLVFSFIFLFLYDFPPTLIPDAVMSGLFPMLFFFVGAEDKDRNTFETSFYKFYFLGAVFLFICSIYLFVTVPSWYIEWKISMQPEEWQDNPRVLGAMSGFSGSGYLVGYTAFFAFCYLIFRLKNKVANMFDYFFLFIVVFCLIFSQVRVALLGASFVLLWFLKKTLSIRNFIIVLIVVIAFIALFSYLLSYSESLSTLFDFFTAKLEGASEDTRYETGISLLSSQTNFIFGHGYGTGGHKAAEQGLPAVTDMEYVKLFYETGIIGTTLFFLIVFKALKKSTWFSFEFFIIVFYLLAMLIANPLTAEATMSPVFWYAVGRAACKQSIMEFKTPKVNYYKSV